MLAADVMRVHNFTVTWKSRGVRTTDDWEHKLYTAVLTNSRGERFTFPYRTGMAIDKPTADDVLECLALDCRVYEEHDSAADVQSTFGNTPERAQWLYLQCQKVSNRLYEWVDSPDAFYSILSVGSDDWWKS